MTPDEHELKRFVDRHLPSPTHMEFTAARERVLDQMRATPSHLLKPRIAETAPAVSWRRTAVAVIAAAAMIALVVAIPLRPANWIATVEAADGSSYTLQPNTVLSATDARGLQVRLKDGSRIEMRSASELSLDANSNGIGIRLLAGDIIVDAVAPRDDRLSVQTRDLTVLVGGTVSLVKTVGEGSRVGVIKGEARVREGGVEKVVRAGEQVSTSPALAARPLRDDVAWSRDANAHQTILDAFMKAVTQTTTGTLAPVAPQGQSPAAVNGQAATPEFEEASIRECDPDNLPPLPPGTRGGGANSVLMTPGRYYALCITPATLIRVAYGYRAVNVEALIPEPPLPRGGRALLRGRFGVVGSLGMEDGSRIRGGPDWVRKEQFTIEAIADGSTEAATMSGPMLRALLERRFKLKTHVETEQTLAYNLVVAPGGLKIKPVSAGSCEMPPANPSLPLVNGMPQARPRSVADTRLAAKPLCGVSNGPNGPNWVTIGGEATFGDLVGVLRNRFDRGSVRGIAITDRTGITDKFNWDLESLVDANAGPTFAYGLRSDGDAADVPRAPAIFVALEEQLGLRLEPVQVPREYLMIDAIEKPGPN